MTKKTVSYTLIQLRDPTKVHDVTEFKRMTPVYADAISDAKLNRRGQQQRQIVFQDESLYSMQCKHPQPQHGKHYSSEDMKLMRVIAAQYTGEPTQGPICAELLKLALDRGRTFYGVYMKAYNMDIIPENQPEL